MSKDKEWKIETIPDLTRRILDIWNKKEKEALALQAEQKEKLKAEIQNEKELTGKLKDARSIASKMEKEYLKIEIKVEEEKREIATKDALRENDVKSGKVSLKQFMSKGKRDSEISDEVLRESASELEKGLLAIHEKNKELLGIELLLSECQHKIRGLIIEPARILSRTFKDLAEISGIETGLFEQDYYGARDVVEQKKQEILLTEGKSMSGRHVWDQLTMKQARALQFDPILPLSCIGKLKSLLAKYRGADGIAITYYLNLRTIEITSITPRRSGLIQTIDVKEDPRAEFKRK